MTKVKIVIPLDTPACTVCGDITVDLDGVPKPCQKHPNAPLIPREAQTDPELASLRTFRRAYEKHLDAARLLARTPRRRPS